MEYRSGAEVCDEQILEQVTCLAGYDEKAGECHPIPTKSKTELQVVMAVSISTVLALCAGLLIFLVYKHPKKAKTILISFMRMCNGLSINKRKIILN